MANELVEMLPGASSSAVSDAADRRLVDAVLAREGSLRAAGITYCTDICVGELVPVMALTIEYRMLCASVGHVVESGAPAEVAVVDAVALAADARLMTRFVACSRGRARSTDESEAVDVSTVAVDADDPVAVRFTAVRPKYAVVGFQRHQLLEGTVCWSDSAHGGQISRGYGYR